MRIPKQFNLLGQVVMVEYDKNLLATQSARGMYHPVPFIIMLQPKDGSIGHFQSSVEQTFCHELIHAILHMMGEEKLYTNEKFVDLFAHLLHQALTTQTFK